MKKLFLIISFLTVISSLSAHEFWLNPDKFLYKQGDKINIRFFVGENFEGENWKGNNEKVQSLMLYYGGVRDDLSKYISKEKGDSIQMVMLDAGTNLVAFNSTNSFIEIEAVKFNEYLAEDGLTNALEFRKQNKEMDSAGREQYQRCAKTLIQVGNKKDNTFSIPTAMKVDIIPLSNPYLIKSGDSLQVKIFFQNNPVSNSQINVWWRTNNQTKKSTLTSNENGEISFPVSATGKWMVSVVQMVRVQDDPKLQWQSYWGSLTWGYE
jgi:uncharacterized GH25 family protein